MAEKPDSAGRIICLAPSRNAGAFGLGAFFSRKLGHPLRLDPAVDGVLDGRPLGPDAQLAILDGSGLGQDVIRRAVCAAPCPVIVVPRLSGQDWSAPKPWARRQRRVILCGTDGSEGAETAAGFARWMAAACAARVVTAAVPHPRDVASGLLKRAAQERAMLVAMGSDCVDPDEFGYATSLTGEVVARADRPVMIVPPWARVLAPASPVRPRRAHGGLRIA